MAEEKETDDKADSGSLTVENALKMFEEYKSYWSDNYREASIDLKMAAGDPYTHYGLGWDDKYTAPTSSMVVDNELPQYIHQVTNDIRQNVPSIKVLPVSEGDIETGEIYSGLFRAIEDHSHADEVCDTAAEYAVTCGIGFMRVDHDYCDEDSDEQEIVFKIVPDPLSVWLDPASVEYDGRDAMGAIALEPINKADFERLYPGKAFISFTDPKAQDIKDTIILAEIFVKTLTGKRGKNATVYRYKFSGTDKLATTTFPGKYVPVVPIYGQVTWIDGKRVLSSLIRQARSPQRRLNHMLSKESQVLAQAPIAPILAVEGTLVNERKQYQIPGLENALEYRQTDIDGNQAPAPIRLQPPGASTGFLEAIASAKEAIKASMGIYNAGLGKREGDASGIALKQLDQSGDIATFHYPDNVRRSYGHTGEIGVDMMPVIYDTARILQTLNDEQDVQMVGVNGAPMQDGQKRPYDLTKGKYRVRITTGASYTTRRQEESAFLSAIFQKDPSLMQIGGDILFKSLDSPGAQALAARVKKTIPPQLLEDNGNDDPKVIQLTQELQKAQQIIQAGAQEMQQLQTQLQSKQAKDQADGTKAQADMIKAQADLLKAKVEAFQVANPQQPQEQAPAPTAPINNPADMNENQLLGLLQDKQTAAQNEQQEAAQQLQLQLQREEFDRQQQQQELQVKQQQTEAVLHTLTAIASQLNQLTAQVSQPKQVMRDPTTGAIMGIS